MTISRLATRLFELADGGTIVLDEVGELPLAVQAKLLRFLEERTLRRLGGAREIAVDVRIIALTNRPLAESFARRYAAGCGKKIAGLSPELQRRLVEHSWTGNVRELRNLMERAVILAAGDVLDAADVGVTAAAPGKPAAAPITDAILPLEEVELLMVERALRASNGNQSKAARLLQVSRDQLRYRVKRYRETGRLNSALETEPFQA